MNNCSSTNGSNMLPITCGACACMNIAHYMYSHMMQSFECDWVRLPLRCTKNSVQAYIVLSICAEPSRQSRPDNDHKYRKRLDGIVSRTKILEQLVHKLCVSMWMEQKKNSHHDGDSLRSNLRRGRQKNANYDGQFDVLYGMRNADTWIESALVIFMWSIDWSIVYELSAEMLVYRLEWGNHIRRKDESYY